MQAREGLARQKAPLGHVLPVQMVLHQAEVAGSLHAHLAQATDENPKELTARHCPLPTLLP